MFRDIILFGFVGNVNRRFRIRVSKNPHEMTESASNLPGLRI
jgi:hypothetical protein